MSRAPTRERRPVPQYGGYGRESIPHREYICTRLWIPALGDLCATYPTACHCYENRSHQPVVGAGFKPALGAQTPFHFQVVRVKTLMSYSERREESKVSCGPHSGRFSYGTSLEGNRL